MGSLGKYLNEGDVSGLVVRDCTMTGTMNGIRIKTWPNSPGSSAATNMTFENIVMKNVTNPIIIDQSYCPFTSCATPKVNYRSSCFFKLPILLGSWLSCYRNNQIPLITKFRNHQG